MKYTVWSLDVWGHSPSECTDYDCPCIEDKEHDDNACTCGYDVNDRCRVGSVEIPDRATDAGILALLDNNGYIHAHEYELDDYSDGSVFEIVARSNGRPLLSLEACEP